MHKSCSVFWEFVYKEYSSFFKDEILEMGSYDINGSIKNIIGVDCKRYVGVDWRGGPNVDVVSLAHNFKSNNRFKAVVSASMLEHDPYWEASLNNMIDHLNDGGILILTWGSALNIEHCLEEAPDGKFHPLKAENVKNFLENRGVFVYSFSYDANLNKLTGDDIHPSYFAHIGNNGLGECNLIGFKKSYIDDFVDEDREYFYPSKLMKK